MPYYKRLCIDIPIGEQVRERWHVPILICTYCIIVLTSLYRECTCGLDCDDKSNFDYYRGSRYLTIKAFA